MRIAVAIAVLLAGGSAAQAVDLRGAPPLLQADALVGRLQPCLYAPDDASAAGASVRLHLVIEQGLVTTLPVLAEATADPAAHSLRRAITRALVACAPYPEWMSFSADLDVTVNVLRIALTPRNATTLP